MCKKPILWPYLRCTLQPVSAAANANQHRTVFAYLFGKSKRLGQHTAHPGDTYLQEITHFPIAFLAGPSSWALLPDMAITLVVIPHDILELLQSLIPNIRRHPSNTARTVLVYMPLLGSFQESVFVPLRTGTILPGHRADVAELRAAPARHVVAPMAELDERVAARARLPPIRAPDRAELNDGGVRGAVFAAVFRLLAARAGRRLAGVADDTGLHDPIRRAEEG